MTSQTATAKPYSVKRMEKGTVLSEVVLASGLIASIRTPGRVTWAVAIAGKGIIFENDRPIIFDRRNVAELEADYLNRKAEQDALPQLTSNQQEPQS